MRHPAHPRDVRRPAPRRSRRPTTPAPLVRGGQGRTAEQLLDEGRDAVAILATCGVALVLLVVGAMVIGG